VGANLTFQAGFCEISFNAQKKSKSILWNWIHLDALLINKWVWF